jgi:hypothetical protein
MGDIARNKWGIVTTQMRTEKARWQHGHHQQQQSTELIRAALIGMEIHATQKNGQHKCLEAHMNFLNCFLSFGASAMLCVLLGRKRNSAVSGSVVPPILWDQSSSR